MQKLPVEISAYGRVQRQVWRDKNTAIYAYHGGYEVIVIRKMPAGEQFGKFYPAREAYPHDEQWGTMAITRPASDTLDYLKERAAKLFAEAPQALVAPKMRPARPFGRMKGAGDGA